MSHTEEAQDAADLKEFLAERDEKLAFLHKAIDALIDVADEGLGGPTTSDALNYLNLKCQEIKKKYGDNT